MLAEHQVEAIYMVKISIMADFSSRHSCNSGRLDAIMRGKSGPLAKCYGVTSRAIRDIWNRKTWSYATERLWVLEADHAGSLSVSCLSSPCSSPDQSDSAVTFARTCAECIGTNGQLIDSDQMVDLKTACFSSRGSCNCTLEDLVTSCVPIVSPDWADPFHADWPHW